MRLKPELVDCKTWGDLDKAIEVLVGDEPYQWLFRGLRHSHWTLQPTIERACALSNQLDTERRLLSEFQAKAHLYAQQVPARDDLLAWLSMMQHYGVATRLLDWTYSAYVGLFFAVDVEAKELGALWAVHNETLQSAFGRAAAAVLRQAYGGLHGRRAEDFKSIAFPPAFERSCSSDGLVAPLLPGFHVSRLSSQQGCFLINCNYQMAFEESLADMMKDEKRAWLFKITFPQSLRVVILKRLMHFNIHPATLFPDLEGLAKFISLKNELFPTSGTPR